MEDTTTRSLPKLSSAMFLVSRSVALYLTVLLKLLVAMSNNVLREHGDSFTGQRVGERGPARFFHFTSSS
ncbi:hypothetical protein M758_UG147900 [Ceratodon purpureus]|nr:hypothetical protein M758_UG147900 [Ceratodon purpureus]